MRLLQKIEKSALILAQAAKGNPAITTFTVILYMFFFNLMEATVEKLLFGERFEHWLDPVFISLFIGYAAYTVLACAAVNVNENVERSNASEIQKD